MMIKTKKQWLTKYVSDASRFVVILEKVLIEVHKMGQIDEQMIKNGSYEYTKALDTLIFRFMKLQDLMGGKIFPLLLNILGNDAPNQTFIDVLNKLEKLGYLESAHQWRNLRDARNDLSHEYAEDDKALAERTNEIINYANFLVSYWKVLKQKIELLDVYD